MVRFIMKKQKAGLETEINLHSNMVRFIIHEAAGFNKLLAVFTFQYG